MRTTLTLDDDVAAKLEFETRRSGRSFKQVVNDLLRSALSAHRKQERRRPFRIQAHDLGLQPGLGYDSVSDLLEQVEGPQHR